MAQSSSRAMAPFLVLVACSFSGALAAAEPTPAARIGSVTISLADFVAQRDATLRQTSYHKQSSPERRAEVGSQLLQQMIDEQLLLQATARRKVKLDPARLQALVDEQANNLGGKKRFEAMLASRKMTEQQFAQLFEKQALIETLLAQLTAMDPAKAKQEARAYYDANQARYVMAASSRLRFAQAKVDPGNITQSRQQTAARAPAIAEAMASGASIDELTKKFPGDEFKDLGWVHQGSLDPSFAEAEQDTPVGQVSRPIPNTFGVALLQVLERRQPQQLTYETVEAAVIAERAAERRKLAREQLLAEMRQSIKVEVLVDPKTVP